MPAQRLPASHTGRLAQAGSVLLSTRTADFKQDSQAGKDSTLVTGPPSLRCRLPDFVHSVYGILPPRKTFPALAPRPVCTRKTTSSPDLNLLVRRRKSSSVFTGCLFT